MSVQIKIQNLPEQEKTIEYLLGAEEIKVLNPGEEVNLEVCRGISLVIREKIERKHPLYGDWDGL